jgi:hypothetical protein
MALRYEMTPCFYRLPLQANNISACVKHYVGNNFETVSGSACLDPQQHCLSPPQLSRCSQLTHQPDWFLARLSFFATRRMYAPRELGPWCLSKTVARAFMMHCHTCLGDPQICFVAALPRFLAAQ